MSKSDGAFRTISEVAEDLGVPAHVLRFWETKFPQLKPMKRGGGRRYYRPEDVALLRGIQRLLHVEGYSIKGAQKLLREQGVRHVAAVGEAEAEVIIQAVGGGASSVARAPRPEKPSQDDLFNSEPFSLVDDDLEVDEHSIVAEAEPAAPVALVAVTDSAAAPALSADDRGRLQDALSSLLEARDMLRAG